MNSSHESSPFKDGCCQKEQSHTCQPDRITWKDSCCNAKQADSHLNAEYNLKLYASFSSLFSSHFCELYCVIAVRLTQSVQVQATHNTFGVDFSLWSKPQIPGETPPVDHRLSELMEEVTGIRKQNRVKWAMIAHREGRRSSMSLK